MSSDGEHYVPVGNTVRKTSRFQFVVGGILILGALILWVAAGTVTSSQLYVTVDQLLQDPGYLEQNIRLSGVVLGETISYDARTAVIEFEIVNLPNRVDNLAVAIRDAVNAEELATLHVHIEGEVMPDLLQNGAQAILTGHLREDGVFYATELFLKCPTRMEERVLDARFIPHSIEINSLSVDPSAQ